jgi:hypothetical protein
MTVAKHTPGPAKGEWRIARDLLTGEALTYEDGRFYKIIFTDGNWQLWPTAEAQSACNRLNAALVPDLVAEVERLREACRFTLELLDNLTTARFAAGEDKPARVRLRAALQPGGKGEA